MGVKTSYSIFVFTFISILVGINTTNRKVEASCFLNERGLYYRSFQLGYWGRVAAKSGYVVFYFLLTWYHIKSLCGCFKSRKTFFISLRGSTQI